MYEVFDTLEDTLMCLPAIVKIEMCVVYTKTLLSDLVSFKNAS